MKDALVHIGLIVMAAVLLVVLVVGLKAEAQSSVKYTKQIVCFAGASEALSTTRQPKYYEAKGVAVGIDGGALVVRYPNGREDIVSGNCVVMGN